MAEPITSPFAAHAHRGTSGKYHTSGNLLVWYKAMHIDNVRVSLVPRPSHVFQCENVENMGGLGTRLVRAFLYIYHCQSIFTLSVIYLTLCEVMATLGMAKFKLIGQSLKVILKLLLIVNYQLKKTKRWNVTRP